MNFSKIMIGLLISTLLFLPPPSHAQGIYTETYQKVLDEITRKDAEEVVKKFVAKVYQDELITEIDVTDAILNKANDVCKKRPPLPDKNYATCMRLISNLHGLAGIEEEIRTFGRDLQAIVTGYEIPVDGHPGRLLNFPLRYNGVAKIWQTGIGGLQETERELLVRMKGIDIDTLKPLVQTLKNRLESIEETKQAAAIWRYQHGLRLIRGERSPPYPEDPADFPVIPFHKEADPADVDNGDATERTYLYKRWRSSPDIEGALEAIWDALPKDPNDPAEYDPPLKPDEIVLFVFPKDFIEQNLPGNVLLWATIDGTGESGPQPNGDIGLHFQIATEPALPNILDPDPILGGRYPPDPTKEKDGDTVPLDGLGLCTHPFPSLGYMCTERKPQSEEECENGPCEDEGEENITDVGPDICEDFEWLLDSTPGASRELCTPGETANYLNTIGNEMCYIGQCMEQSLELHRIVSGRQTFVTMGEAYPWDPLMKEQPIGGAFVMPPPQRFGTLPQYRPELLVRKLDTALCQKNGLPPRTPSLLCMFDARRRLDFPLLTFPPMTESLLTQGLEYAEPTFGLQNLQAGIGTRIGTALYKKYLTVSVRSLAEVIKIANDLLITILKTEFPDKMCTFGVEDP